MNFSDIIGHQEIITALQRVIMEGKVGHAYLFTGAVGSGKKTMARIMAARVLCLSQGEEECRCESCRRFQAGVHPDFIIIEPTGNTIKIEQLRELQKNAHLRPLLSKYKVFFFPEAEQLTEAAANSFLKILEEPPEGVVFLFTAVRPDNLLATVRSRCQIYHLAPVAPAVIAGWLEKRGLTPTEAETRALMAQGAPGKALESGPVAGIVEPDLPEILDLDLLQLLKKANDLEKKERREVLNLLQLWQAQARKALLDATAQPVPALIKRWLFIIEKLNKIMVMVESNVNQRLAVEEFFVAFKAKGY